MRWWGYKHAEGTIHLKRYFGQGDIWEAKQSPFCETVVGPFTADNVRQAREVLSEALAKGETNEV